MQLIDGAGRPPGHRPRQQLAVLAAACCAGLVVVYLAAADTGLGREIDRAALHRAPGAFAPWQAADRVFFSFNAVTLTLAAAALWAIARARGRPVLGRLALLLVAGAVAWAWVLKRVLRHAVAAGGDPHGLIPSYPSAHASTALALGLGLLLVAPPAIRGRLAVVVALGVAVVGISTLVIHAHRPSDVAGAYLLTTGWAAVVLALAPVLGGLGEQPQPARPRRGHALVLSAAAVALACAAAVAVLTVPAAYRVVDRGLFGSALAVLLLAAAAVAVFLAALSADAAPAPRS